jgi:CubicO group peptidase (beta-lactamase class C family)
MAQKIKHSPGSHHEYSNLGYNLLAVVVESTSGRRFQDFMVEELLRPAGLEDSSFSGEPGLDLGRVPRSHSGTGTPLADTSRVPWFYLGSAGNLATVRDLWLWDRALRGDSLLDAPARKQLYRPALESYALGWVIGTRAGETIAFHDGSIEGVNTFFVRGLDSGVVVAVARSQEDEQGRLEEFSMALFEAAAAAPRADR